jgi:ferric-dicitrate binding protein FerR (iron transport regulator)
MSAVQKTGDQSAQESAKDSDVRRRRQRARNWAIFLALAAFVLIVYVVTIVRMKGG